MVFIIGAALIFLYDAIRVRGEMNKGRNIEVSERRIQVLVSNFERSYKRPLSDVEFDNIIDEWAREEVLFRKACIVSRRSLRQSQSPIF